MVVSSFVSIRSMALEDDHTTCLLGRLEHVGSLLFSNMHSCTVALETTETAKTAEQRRERIERKRRNGETDDTVHGKQSQPRVCFCGLATGKSMRPPFLSTAGSSIRRRAKHNDGLQHLGRHQRFRLADDEANSLPLCRWYSAFHFVEWADEAVRISEQGRFVDEPRFIVEVKESAQRPSVVDGEGKWHSCML